MDYLQIDDITEEEKELVIELRKRMENEMSPTLLKDNTVFIRFLRARDCNVEKATEMLKSHIERRRFDDTDNLSSYKDPEVMKYLPSNLLGFDKLGFPIRYIDVGNFDIKGMLKSARRHELIKSIAKICESDTSIMRQQSIKYGRTIDKWVSIYNLENISFSLVTNKSAVQFCVYLSKLYESNYPERIKVTVVINASPYFALLFSVIKPMLTSRTLQKVKIFGKDGWKDELMKYIDADVLPIFLGGTRTDEYGDPMCSSFVRHGCPVPESYYFRSYERRLSSRPDINKMVVARMSKNTVELDIKRAGYYIEWQFETESGDISFGLYMEVDGQSENHTLKEIIPTQRVEAHIASETGTYRCEEPGKYFLQFDNTHSWLKVKEVFYRIEVVEYDEVQ